MSLDPNDFTFDQFNAAVDRQIETYRFCLISINGDVDSSPFTYTAGLTLHGYPELLLIDDSLSVDDRAWAIQSTAFEFFKEDGWLEWIYRPDVISVKFSLANKFSFIITKCDLEEARPYAANSFYRYEHIGLKFLKLKLVRG